MSDPEKWSLGLGGRIEQTKPYAWLTQQRMMMIRLVKIARTTDDDSDVGIDCNEVYRCVATSGKFGSRRLTQEDISLTFLDRASELHTSKELRFKPCMGYQDIIDGFVHLLAERSPN
jgi:hypothetical protein